MLQYTMNNSENKVNQNRPWLAIFLSVRIHVDTTLTRGKSLQPMSIRNEFIIYATEHTSLLSLWFI